jgi:hypothetical protein
MTGHYLVDGESFDHCGYETYRSNVYNRPLERGASYSR